MIQRVILMILDSLGVGALPDAGDFNDAGSHTLLHIFQQRGGLRLPHLCSLGLGRITDVGCPSKPVLGCFGKMAEQSASKDTTTGHWEIAGLVTRIPFPTFPKGFPPEVILDFESAIGTKTLGNYPKSGTQIIDDLGPEHLETGFPIVYTSADSVFQIAAHEAVIPLETLYHHCRAARKILSGPYAVGRVIARPFRGEAGRFERINAARKDFSRVPPQDTLLDLLQKKGLFTAGVGKIGDIFGHRGLSHEIHTQDNADGIRQTLDAMERLQNEKGLIFVNLVDFDMVYGHRRNVEGYALALEAFDSALPQILSRLGEKDVLIITADHGCDPTHNKHTDHTREFVPLLIHGKSIASDVDLGLRPSFADCGQTIADLLGAGKLPHGTSFKKEIMNE